MLSPTSSSFLIKSLLNKVTRFLIELTNSVTWLFTIFYIIYRITRNLDLDGLLQRTFAHAKVWKKQLRSSFNFLYKRGHHRHIKDGPSKSLNLKSNKTKTLWDCADLIFLLWSTIVSVTNEMLFHTIAS